MLPVRSMTVAGKPVAALSGAVVLFSLVIGFAGSLGAVLVLPDSAEQFLCDLLIYSMPE